MQNTIKKYFIPLLLLLAIITYTSNELLALHEPIGIFLLGLFILHVLDNRKLVSYTIKQLFQTKQIKKRKSFYIIDFLLCITFTITAISGIASSQFLFNYIYKDSIAEHLHIFSAFLALILLFIHLIQHRKQTLIAIKNLKKQRS